MRTTRGVLVLWLAGVVGAAGCGGSGEPPAATPLVVNSTRDLAMPPPGEVTLRAALSAAPGGTSVRFDPRLDGATISLAIVGEEHTPLVGEVMGMREEESGPVSYLVGWLERDYGRSALYAAGNVTIDASDLPHGVTVAWDEPDVDARVLAVRGDLVMRNVTIRGGRSRAEALPTTDPEDQPWTLARGGAVAVWGVAWLQGCTLYDNHCVGDFDSSRDRGAFGGGIYADILHLQDCVVCGNTVLGAGAAGGGVYSVGGAGRAAELSTLSRCSITGNRIQALMTYGGGVYSDGGGIGNRKTLRIANSTIAENVVEPAPGLPPFLLAMGYWRGGGIYMSNGHLELTSSTVVQNEVYGVPRTDDLGKPNLAGGIAATIGNAHAVEDMVVGHSIVAGNTVHELAADGTVTNTYAHDLFTGSLLYFRSLGHNCFGVLDFSQILVPVGEPDWWSLCRKHVPQPGDMTGVDPAQVLDLAGADRSEWMMSAGVGTGAPALLSCPPAGAAADCIPAAAYDVEEVLAEYSLDQGGTDDFLEILLSRIEDRYGLVGFAADVKASFEAWLGSVDADEATPGVQPWVDPDGVPILTLADTRWFGPAVTWPKERVNRPWIEFWHRLDAALAAEAIPGMGPELLGDQAWLDLFEDGPLVENPALSVRIATEGAFQAELSADDQEGRPRPAGAMGDVGAIETP